MTAHGLDVAVGLHDLVYLLTDVVATEQGTYIPYATLLKSCAVSRTTLVRPTLHQSDFQTGVVSQLVYLTIRAVLGLHSNGVSLWVTAARVKTQKSNIGQENLLTSPSSLNQRARPCMQQRLDQKRWQAVTLGLNLCHPRRPSSSHFFPPDFPGCSNPGSGGADSTV